MSEKKRPEEDEVTEEELKDISGGATASAAQQDVGLAKQFDVSSAAVMDKLAEGGQIDQIHIDAVDTPDDEDD